MQTLSCSHEINFKFHGKLDHNILRNLLDDEVNGKHTSRRIALLLISLRTPNFEIQRQTNVVVFSSARLVELVMNYMYCTYYTGIEIAGRLQSTKSCVAKSILRRRQYVVLG